MEGALAGGAAASWTRRLKARLEYVDANDGTFWMAFDDFARHFRQVYVCRVLRDDEWLTARCRGRSGGRARAASATVPAPKRYVRNPQLRLRVGGDVPVDVLLFLEQHDDRLEDGADGDRAIGFSVYANGGRRLTRLARAIVKSRLVLVRALRARGGVAAARRVHAHPVHVRSRPGGRLLGRAFCGRPGATRAGDADGRAKPALERSPLWRLMSHSRGRASGAASTRAGGARTPAAPAAGIRRCSRAPCVCRRGVCVCVAARASRRVRRAARKSRTVAHA